MTTDPITNDNWYSKTSNPDSPHEQGLVIDENTGANIAVSYNPKHAPLIAAVPALLRAVEFYANPENWKDVDTGIGTLSGEAVDNGAVARVALARIGN